MNDDEIKNLIDAKIKAALSFSNSLYGDTPTDALQLTPKKYVDGQIYSGFIASNSQGNPFPSGWSTSVLSTGQIEIIHNFNSSVYGVGCTLASTDPHGEYGATASIVEPKGNNSFIVSRGFLNSGIPTELSSDFSFVVIKK